MELRSDHNEMIIVFHATKNVEKARGLRVEYSFETIHCGGVYTENEGFFAFHTFSIMRSIRNCVWILQAPENNHIKLVLDYDAFSEQDRLLVFANTTGGVDYTLLK